jgi:hypothetical protein
LGERFFQDLLGDERSELSKHPGDYQLYRVGTFDSESGAFVSDVPTLMISGSEDGKCDGKLKVVDA